MRPLPGGDMTKQYGLKLFGIAAISLIGIIAATDVALTQERPRPYVLVTPQLSPGSQWAYVREGIGYDRRAHARDYAKLYLPYARMSTVAYTEPEDQTSANCPDLRKLTSSQSKTAQVDAERHRAIVHWTQKLSSENWKCRTGRVGPLPCPKGQPNCWRIGGLQLHVWVQSKGGATGKCVVAFRGTDWRQASDWVSNFRWLRGVFRTYDQYDQVRAHIRKIVAENCGGGAVFATGHSLGGGLAQFAAYNDAKFRYVYAFDPSPVTGFDVPAHDPLRHKRRGYQLGIDRVHEQGEVLAGLRFFIGGSLTPQECQPLTRSVRFNTLRGSLVQQHSIAGLTGTMATLASDPKSNPAAANGSARALRCVPGHARNRRT